MMIRNCLRASGRGVQIAPTTVLRTAQFSVSAFTPNESSGDGQRQAVFGSINSVRQTESQREELKNAQNDIQKLTSKLLNPYQNSARSNQVEYQIRQENPRNVARELKISDTTAGRTVLIGPATNFRLAVMSLNGIVSRNRIAEFYRRDLFYLKPGKKREQDKSRNHRKRFLKGVKRLFAVVRDAKRKGY